MTDFEAVCFFPTRYGWGTLGAWNIVSIVMAHYSERINPLGFPSSGIDVFLPALRVSIWTSNHSK